MHVRQLRLVGAYESSKHTLCHSIKKAVYPSRVRVILAAFVFLTSQFFPAFAGAQSPDPRFTHLTSEQGLSHNMVRCILQDNEGFMWFGTESGLNKYDGYTFTVYRHERSDPDTLSSSSITALHQDHSGTL
ncbi:MAG: two-component regulator propeller domain-containing protein [Anaerolineae bacterium]